MTTPNLAVSLLGPYAVLHDQAPVTRFGSIRAQALLAFLLIEGEQIHRRSTLAGLLWPDLSEGRARHNLSQTLLRLRQALGDTDKDSEFFRIDAQTLGLQSPHAIWVDVNAFNALVRRGGLALEARATPRLPLAPDARLALEQAAELYRGELLADFSLPDSDLFEQWLYPLRTALHRRALAVLEVLADDAERQANDGAALAYARRLLALDDYAEPAHRRVIRLLARDGQRRAALTHADRLVELLARELGTTPDPATTALIEALRAGYRDGVGASPAPGPPATRAAAPHQDWAEAPAPAAVYGRQAEVEQLTQWLVQERCRLVGILGLGGQGKTTLAAHGARTCAGAFDVVIWRSLIHAPPPDEMVRDWLRQVLGSQLVQLPVTLDGCVHLLFQSLRSRRCLLVLDNFESVLQFGSSTGAYKRGYEAYGRLLQQIGELDHQSCLVLTSRERPPQFAYLERRSMPVHSLQLPGLAVAAGQAVLREKHVRGRAEEEEELIAAYSGNPLALILVADTIQELFGGDVGAFLAQDVGIFDDIRFVLDQQFDRLSVQELALMQWLAVEREPVAMDVLAADMRQPSMQPDLLMALRSLLRRSLVEQHGTCFTLQNVVMDYTSERLVQAVCTDIERGKPTIMAQVALLKAEAPDYIRLSQQRVILQPIVACLTAHLGVDGLVDKLKSLLTALHGDTAWAQSYAAGNILNLLLHLKVDLCGLDLARLAVWQVYAQNRLLRDVDLTDADLSGTVFTGTFGQVLAVAFSPDGRLVAARTGDEAVSIFSVADGRLHTKLQAQLNQVWPVLFGAGGEQVIAGGRTTDIFVWDLASKAVRHVLTGHTLRIWAAAISPDRRHLATASEDHTVRLWDLERGRALQILTGHTRTVWCVAFSPDGRHVASGSADGTVWLWHGESGTGEILLTGCGRGVRALAFTPDGRRLAVAGYEQAITLWDLNTRALINSWPVGARIVFSLACSPDGQRLASGDSEHRVCLWDLAGHGCRVFAGHDDQVLSVAFSPDGRILASGGWDQTLRLWDCATGRTLRVLHGALNWVEHLAFSPGGNQLASATRDQEIRLWDVASGDLRQTLAGHAQRVRCLAFSPSGALLASGGADPGLCLWDTASGKRLAAPDVQAPVGALSFAADERALFGFVDRAVTRLDLQTGEQTRVVANLDEAKARTVFGGGGRYLAATDDAHRIHVWDLAAGRLVHVLTGHTYRPFFVAISADGHLLASGGVDKVLRLWDMASGAELAALEGHHNTIFTAVFGPTKGQVVSTGEEGLIYVWDVAARRLVRTLDEHTEPVWSLAMHPAGTMVASGSANGTIKLWETATWRCRKTIQVPGPYAGTNIAGVRGVTAAQKAALRALGAIDARTHGSPLRSA